MLGGLWREVEAWNVGQALPLVLEVVDLEVVDNGSKYYRESQLDIVLLNPEPYP